MSKPSYPKTQEIFRKLFFPERRVCAFPGCEKVFFCSGMCPSGRWHSKAVVRSLSSYTGLCYCKECMKKSTHSMKEKRLEVCYG